MARDEEEGSSPGARMEFEAVEINGERRSAGRKSRGGQSGSQKTAVGDIPDPR
jgi:hypothetical protein